MSDQMLPHVVVLGGGSAGWITACLLHKKWGHRGGKVTVVESPEIGIIGVGEGSTPQLKAFFDYLGIAENTWMAACDATYKLGIRFSGWSKRTGYESYFHPFPGPIDLHSEPAFTHCCTLARRGFKVKAHPDAYFLSTLLAKQMKSPHPDGNFPFPPSYGYHFDAYKLGIFLSNWAVQQGVIHVPRKVISVELANNGDVSALLLDAGGRIEGDIFVDCSGFRGLIAQGALGTRFLSFSDNLFNDCAVVMPTQHKGPYNPQTESIAMRAGWRWSIPLISRIGNGYVYASSHISDDEAEAELRAAIGAEKSDTDARFLKLKVGRLEKSWVGNCLAAGLAQGFIEPLEATALHIVIATALDFAKAYEGGGFTAQNRDAFNDASADRFEAIRDYIVGHYRLNQRTDTRYWRDNAANQNLSLNLKAMMTAWYTHKDLSAANAETYSIPAYSQASWQCLFAGYGSFPEENKLLDLPFNRDFPDLEALSAMLEACSHNFAKLKPATHISN